MMIDGLGLQMEQAIQISRFIGSIILVMSYLYVVAQREILLGKRLKFSAYISIKID